VSEKKNEKKKDPIQKVLKYLPPNYTVAGVYVNGALAPVVNFVTKKDGLGYFINEAAAVSLFDAGRMDGIVFGAAEAAEPEEEEEEET
jgi:hypothetical protein